MTPTEFRRVRKAAGLSQAQMAERLKVSRKTIVNWEKEIFNIPADISAQMESATLAPAAPKETDKQRMAREAAEHKEAKHWAMVYRATRAWPQYSSHAKVMTLLASQGHVIPRCAYASIVAEFPDILTDPNGEHAMSKEQALATVLETAKGF